MKKRLALLSATVLSLGLQQAQGELLVGISLFGEVLTFDSAAPSVIVNGRGTFVSGLTGQAQGEAISAIDYRPATGTLYALGNAPGGTSGLYRLYTLNIATGVASRVGNTDYNTFTGTFFGFDFNPVVDRIRVVNDGENNARLHPDTGALAASDPAINPAGELVAVAYDRNDNNAATATTLFGIDSGANTLVRIGGPDGDPSPNGGAVTTIGPLGVDSTGRVSFDISSTSGLAYAGLSFTDAQNTTTSSLYTINLLTGGATLLGPIGDGSIALRALSVQIIPEPGSLGLLATVGGLLVGCMRGRKSARAVA
ncbi:MAG TPA: DUF4394 domain-containing protein [Chthoniobacteraceae bacterium]|jgi:hypothetical protein